MGDLENTNNEQNSEVQQDAVNAESERVKALETQLAEALAQKKNVTDESIGRRLKLSEIREENSALEERLAALEAEARDSRLKAARLEAITAHSLPAEVGALLGEDPEAIGKNAEVLAAVLSAKKQAPAPTETKDEPEVSVPEPKPRGGRNPAAPPATDINALIAQYSQV